MPTHLPNSEIDNSTNTTPVTPLRVSEREENEPTVKSVIEQIKFRWLPMGLCVSAGLLIAIYHHDTTIVMETLVVVMLVLLPLWAEYVFDLKKTVTTFERRTTAIFDRETNQLREEVISQAGNLLRNVRHVQVFNSYDELVKNTSNLFKTLRANSKVFVYRGYDISDPKTPDYYNETIDAILDGRIISYTRVMCVCRLANIQHRLERLKRFSAIPNRDKRCTFWVSYRVNPNYFSFITFGEEEVILSFPDAGDIHAGTGVKQSSCGVYLRDRVLNHVLTTMVQQEIARHNNLDTRHIKRIEVPDEDRDHEWNLLFEAIRNGLEEYSKGGHTDYKLDI